MTCTSKSGRGSRLAAALALGTVILLAAGWPPVIKDTITDQGNESSRFAAIESIVERHTTAIDDSVFFTVDKGYVNGHWYSDKPPLLTLAAAGVCAAAEKIFGWDFRRNRTELIAFVNYVCRLFSVTVGTLAAFALLRRRAPEWDETATTFLATVPFFSTLAWSYSVTLGNHVPAAAVILLLAAELDHREMTPLRGLAAGLTAGLLLLIEYVPGAAFAGALLLHLRLLRRDAAGTRTLLAAGAGIAAALVLLAVLNVLNHGSPLPLYMATHRPDLGKNLAFYAFHALFGFEGLFLYTPALLGVPFLLRDPDETLRNRLLLAAGATMLIYLVATSDFGGWCYGFRFFVSVAPLLMLYLLLHFWRRRGWARMIFAAVTLWGMVTALIGIYNPWTPGYEGSRTEYPVDFEVRSALPANLLAWSYEYAPDSPLCRFLIEDFYGPETALPYLYEAYASTGKTALCDRVKALAEKRLSATPTALFPENDGETTGK